MNPNTGELIRAEALSKLPPERAAEFTVRLDGPPEDIERIASAVRDAHQAKVREANRRKNKAARRARRSKR